MLYNVGQLVLSRTTWDKVPAGLIGTVIEVSISDETKDLCVVVEWDEPGSAGTFEDAFTVEQAEYVLVPVARHLTTQQRLALHVRYELALEKILDVCRQDGSLDTIKDLVEEAQITDDCPICVHPWGYCICKT